MRHLIQYTHDDDRSGVWEGLFEETNNINVGDQILVHHKCICCLKPLVRVVTKKIKAYTFIFEGKKEEVFDYHVKGGGCYKSNMKLISKYDSRVGDCDVKIN